MIRPRIPCSNGCRNSLANKVHVGQRGEAACTYSLWVICRMNSHSYKLEIPQLIHAKCQRLSAVSHLTTGSFSLTPSVRSTNMRNGFRLCELGRSMRIYRKTKYPEASRTRSAWTSPSCHTLPCPVSKAPSYGPFPVPPLNDPNRPVKLLQNPFPSPGDSCFRGAGEETCAAFDFEGAGSPERYLKRSFAESIVSRVCSVIHSPVSCQENTEKFVAAFFNLSDADSK